MKIHLNDIKITPPNMDFNFCVYGKPSEKVLEWINYWKLDTSNSGSFTNIHIGDQTLEDLFISKPSFKYMDGFSPNLNKHLHLGHLSNFIIAKSFQSMGVTENVIAILGDTLDGKVNKDSALNSYKELCEKYHYNIDNIYYASNQELIDGSILHDGDGEFKGTKIFNLPSGEKLVGVKSSGATTYFYQDVALSQHLNGSTLYVTGHEQSNHFSQLGSIVNGIEHCGLGLVLINNKKMSSSSDNFILLSEMFDLLDFDNDYLKYNIMAGQFLNCKTNSNKNVKLKTLSDPKNSLGLYLSYTLARLYSAGLELEKVDLDNDLKFAYLKAKYNLDPATLFKELDKKAKVINNLYTKHQIKDNTENQKMFKKLGDQLLSGMQLLGMYNIHKV